MFKTSNVQKAKNKASFNQHRASTPAGHAASQTGEGKSLSVTVIARATWVFYQENNCLHFPVLVRSTFPMDKCFLFSISLLCRYFFSHLWDTQLLCLLLFPENHNEHMRQNHQSDSIVWLLFLLRCEVTAMAVYSNFIFKKGNELYMV